MRRLGVAARDKRDDDSNLLFCGGKFAEQGIKAAAFSFNLFSKEEKETKREKERMFFHERVKKEKTLVASLKQKEGLSPPFIAD